MAIDAREVAGEAGQDVAAGQAEGASAQPQEQRGGPFDWLRSTFFGGGGDEPADGADGAASEGTEEQPGAGPATDKAAAAVDGETITLSRAEYRQRVQQSARDILAAENARNETRTQRDERLRMARDEPYKLADAEIERLEAEQHAETYQAQFVESVKPVLQIVDAEVVGPVVLALPEAARDKLFADMPADLAGVGQRRYIVQQGLAELQRHWEAEGARKAEQRLRSNGTIVKQVLAEQRAEAEEPDLIPAAGVPHRTDMDSILRAAAGVSS